MTNYILAYYQAIMDGSEVVGRWVRMLYEYIIKGLEQRLFFYDAKKAQAAIRFIENFCHHHEGDLAPGLIKLELWQRALVSLIFGIVDEDGARHFREIFVVIARKNGKTLLAAAIAAYCTYLDGEYGGKIYFAAPKLEQAGLCFDAYYQMILQEPELAALAKKRRTDIYIASSNTSAKPIAFSAKKSDGFNISLGVADEVASWAGDQGLKFYEVLNSSFGARRQPILLSITTAGYVSDGIFDELMKRSTRFLLGDSKERRLLPLLYMIDAIEKWNDINELRKANPNMGVSVSVDYLIEKIATAEGSLSAKSEFLTKYCCIKQNSSIAWLNAQDVEKCTGAPLELEQFRGTYCVGGIDLSRTTDLTSCCVVIQKGGRLYVISKFFLPREKIDDATAKDGVPYRAFIQRGLLQESGDNFVDYTDCLEWFRMLVRDYEILPLKVGYDRYNSQYLTQSMKQDGFHMDDVYQGENLSPIIDELEGEIKNGNVVIGNNDLLKMHLLDSALKQNTETQRKRLIKVSAGVHIDGTAALLDAMTVRQKWWNEIGGQLLNE